MKDNNIYFSFSSIIAKNTIESLTHIIDLAKENNVKSISMQPFLLSIANEKNDLSSFQFEIHHKEYIEQELNKILKYSTDNNIKIYTESLFKDIPLFLCEGIKPKPVNGCKLPSIFIFIGKDCTAFPCFFMINHRPLMGNLNEIKLKDIWHSKVHDAYQNYALNKKCSGCLSACSDIDTIKGESNQIKYQ